jgi:hypothetical protein
MAVAIELQRDPHGLSARRLAEISDRLIQQHGLPAEWPPELFDVLHEARCALAMRDALRWCEANRYPVEMRPVPGTEYRARFIFVEVRHAVEFAARWRPPSAFSPCRMPVAEVVAESAAE